MHFAVASIKYPYARLYKMPLTHHRTQCKKTSYYQRPAIYYEKKLLSGEVKSQIDTCIEDYCQVENYTCF